MSKNLIAYIYLISATALWGGNIIAAKIASNIMLEPIKLSFYRNIIVLIILLPFVLNKLSNNYYILIKHWKIITFLSIVSVSIFNTFMNIALTTTTVISSSLMPSFAPSLIILLSLIIYNSKISFIQLIGCLLVFTGVVIAIFYGTSKSNEHRWEKIEGSVNAGIILGILAALGQAIGIIIMKPILNEGADPIASAAIRTGVSAMALGITYFLPQKVFKDKIKMNADLMIKTIISGFLGMALGMSLLLIALQKGDAGIVATLSSTSPIMILFLIWFLTKKIPVFEAWIGSIIAILGVGFIFIN